MPDEPLPTLTVEEVESHRSSKSCYVILGNNVYDLTDFLDSHPGGGQLILDYAGKDVGDILKNPDSHSHSETAYEVLDDSLVAVLATADGVAANGKQKSHVSDEAIIHENGEKVHPRTGMSKAEDLSRETDYDKDYKTHQFLDLKKPLLMQVWNGGFSKEFYLEQVHRPRHYRGGQSAPIFGNFLEPFSKTPWWLVPVIWLPCISYGTYIARVPFDNPGEQAGWWLFGLFLWSLVEYILHRFLFHLDEYLPDNRVGITLHFLLHGVHHYLPMDKYRLVMPPALFVALAYPVWKLAHGVIYWNWYLATTIFSGGIFGYVCYDLTHYFLHHKNLPLWYKQLKKWHLQHHFLDYENGFGVTSRIWDVVFGTEFVDPAKSR